VAEHNTVGAAFVTNANRVEEQVEVFYAYVYSKKDRRLREEIDKHLSILKRWGVITGWHAHTIHAETEWKGKVSEQLKTARLILFLISPDFLASDYCCDVEMSTAMQKHETGEAVVIPVILRPVPSQGGPFRKLQALPERGKPVTSWSNRDAAYKSIDEGIAEAVDKIRNLAKQISASPDLTPASFVVIGIPGLPMVGIDPAKQFHTIKDAITSSLPDNVTYLDFRWAQGMAIDVVRAFSLLQDGQFASTYANTLGKWLDKEVPHDKLIVFLPFSAGGLIFYKWLTHAKESDIRRMRGAILLGAPHQWSRFVTMRSQDPSAIMNFNEPPIDPRQIVKRLRPGQLTVLAAENDEIVPKSNAFFPEDLVSDGMVSQQVIQSQSHVSLMGSKVTINIILTRLKDLSQGGNLMRITTDSTPNPRAIELFFSYSHRDEDMRDELEKHLSVLRRKGVISGWHDRRILAGEEWRGQIDSHLSAARVILLLVSANFLASDYCWDVEMTTAMQKHETGEAVVIPVILRSCDWKGAPFGKLQALPTDAKPVTEWSSRAAAFENIAKGIRRVVETLSP
jgi:TIR domain